MQNEKFQRFDSVIFVGVQGFVTDGNGLPIERASLKIKGRDVGFQTTRYGEFWRVLVNILASSLAENLTIVF